MSTVEFLNHIGPVTIFLHVNAGMLVYVATKFVLRTRRASLYAIASVAICAALIEAGTVAVAGFQDFGVILGGFAATLFWPCVDYLVVSHRRQRWQVDLTLRELKRMRRTQAKSA